MIRVVALALLAAVAFACSGDDDADTDPATAETTVSSPTTGAEITEDEAVAIAVDAYSVEDPTFDFGTRRVHVEEAGGTFDVSWIPLEITEAGGEPHVVVDAATGEVVEIYLTA